MAKKQDTIHLSDVILSDINPRFITSHKFEKLKNSIREFPKMLEMREIILASRKDYTCLAGNMRMRALLALGYTTAPIKWFKFADELTPEERDRLMIVDNVNFGQWQWEDLSTKWQDKPIEAWGVEVPWDKVEEKELVEFFKNTPKEEKPSTTVTLKFDQEQFLIFDGAVDAWEGTQEEFIIHIINQHLS
jgi:hypothetical protein